jgi:5'-nucleotidase
VNILVTNDDGVFSSGILALAQTMSSLGNIYILAPDHNWSLTGHVKTIGRPLRVQSVNLDEKLTACSTDGSPADCVMLAIMGYFKVPIDLVVSGINTTANLAQDLTCSGTVSAAIEAALHGIPAIAFSLDASHSPLSSPDYKVAARWASKIVKTSLQHQFAPNSFLNVNIPALSEDQINGIQITRLGTRIYYDELESRVDPRGFPYYWIGGRSPGSFPQQGTDVGALEEKSISITPIHLDLTAYQWMQGLSEWNWEQKTTSPIQLPAIQMDCC